MQMSLVANAILHAHVFTCMCHAMYVWVVRTSFKSITTNNEHQQNKNKQTIIQFMRRNIIFYTIVAEVTAMD